MQTVTKEEIMQKIIKIFFSLIKMNFLVIFKNVIDMNCKFIYIIKKEKRKA